MRAGPLSDDRVIELLNRRYVPVYAVNEDHRKGGSAPQEEKAEIERIYHAALKAKLSTGTVHAYVIDTQGRPVDSLHVAEAAKTERLVRFLEDNARRLEAPRGEPLEAPAPQSRPPAAPEGGLVLHLVARTLGAGWNEIPSEDWIVLERSEAENLLPPASAGPGSAWTIPGEVAGKLLLRFYPQTENNQPGKHPFERSSLEGKLLRTEGSRAQVALTGTFRRKHPFYPGRDEERFVDGSVAGLLELDLEARRVLSLRLATNEAVYGKEPFAAALRSLR